jgi:methylglyoxal synthase
MHRQIKKNKVIALIAHDQKKKDLVEWCQQHQKKLRDHTLIATGTTGKIIEQEIGIKVKCYQSGPLGGDQQIGALISEGKVGMLVFFWDPLSAMPHDPDVKAILRLATLWNIPVACNRSTADFIINSKLLNSDYDLQLNHVKSYLASR